MDRKDGKKGKGQKAKGKSEAETTLDLILKLLPLAFFLLPSSCPSCPSMLICFRRAGIFRGGGRHLQLFRVAFMMNRNLRLRFIAFALLAVLLPGASLGARVNAQAQGSPLTQEELVRLVRQLPSQPSSSR